MKLREGNVFSTVCHSVHRGGGGYAGSQVPSGGGGRWVYQGVSIPEEWVYQRVGITGDGYTRGIPPGRYIL